MQGCPLNPIKFSIFINMFYSWLTATSGAGYTLTSPCDARGEAPPLIAAQGFMDDTTLIASTREQSSEQFGKLNTFLSAYGMVVNHGITEPLAPNAGVKCSSLLSMRNGSQGHAIRALLHTYRSVHPNDRPAARGRSGAQPALQKHACPTVTEGLGAIAELPSPGSSAVWQLVTCRPPGALTVGELISDHLPASMPAAHRRSVGALMMLRLDNASVAYLVRRQDGLLEVHITNTTFAGAQSAQDAEVAALALSLRLAPLQREESLNIGWDSAGNMQTPRGPHRGRAHQRPPVNKHACALQEVPGGLIDAEAGQRPADGTSRRQGAGAHPLGGRPIGRAATCHYGTPHLPHQWRPQPQ
jgi:hypothetical protein